MAANPAPDIETLRKRHKELDKLKTEEAVRLKTAEQNLNDLKTQALQQYGTDDLEALQKKLRDMEQENQRQREEYHAHLQQIQEKLEEVKKQFAVEAPAP
jgi:gas vesicle protein